MSERHAIVTDHDAAAWQIDDEDLASRDVEENPENDPFENVLRVLYFNR